MMKMALIIVIQTTNRIEICSTMENKNENYSGIEQLIGNCWEWCQENIYPYDNFKIDPVYREMSYPFFWI